MHMLSNVVLDNRPLRKQESMQWIPAPCLQHAGTSFGMVVRISAFE